MIFILGLIGLTLIVSVGSIFEPLRKRVVTKFLSCSLCVGFWVGMFGELLRQHLDGERLAFFVVVLVGGAVSFLSWLAAVTIHRIEPKP